MVALGLASETSLQRRSVRAAISDAGTLLSEWSGSACALLVLGRCSGSAISVAAGSSTGKGQVPSSLQALHSADLQTHCWHTSDAGYW